MEGFYTVRSTKTRFTNYIMHNGKSIGVINGGLKYEISPKSTLETLLEVAEEVKDTTSISVRMYTV